jgi:sec-independent protein translocase protein TatA
MFILGEIIGWEFLLVLAVIALLFGSSKLPKLARSMGQAKSELEKGMREGVDHKDEPAKS